MFLPKPKLNTIFASRWNALLWSASLLLTVYCSVPSQEETQSVDAADMENAAAAVDAANEALNMALASTTLASDPDPSISTQ